MVTQTPDGKVLFEFYRPGARQVCIAGDFNGWQPSYRMACGRDGWWRSKIELAPGTYHFRYLADDQWFTDYAAFGVEIGPLGWNSVLKVDAPVSEASSASAVPSVSAEPTPAAPNHPEPAPRAEPAASPARFVPASAMASAEPERRVRRKPALAG